MSEIRVNTFKAEDGISAPSFPNGIQVTGVVTATVLDSTVPFLNVGSNIQLGNAGVVTATNYVGTLNTPAQPNITSVGTLSSLNVSGTVSIGGTLTYEDVTNIDSVGLITARTGVISPYVDIDDFISVGNNIHLGNAGVVTATSFVGNGAALTGIDATAIKDSDGDVIIQAQDSGAVFTGIHTFTTSGATLDGSGIKVSTGATISHIGNASFTGIVTATAFVPTQQTFSNRNVIHNGCMMVSQRGISNNGANSSGYKDAPDRWRLSANGSNVGTYTVSRSTDNPGEFAFSYKFDCTSARTPTNNEMLEFEQKIEGRNLQRFAKGTSSAKQFALSFSVKTNVTGTYIALLVDGQNSRMCCATYTVSDSNWNRYNIVFPADTSGTWDFSTLTRLSVKFVLMAGTDFTSGTLQTTWGSAVNANSRVGQTANVGSSTSNEWAITGVQLEAGPVVTPYEHQDYGEVLRQCLRYLYTTSTLGAGVWNGANSFFCAVSTPVPMRDHPSISMYSGGYGGINIEHTDTYGITNVHSPDTGHANGQSDFAQQYSGYHHFTVTMDTSYTNNTGYGGLALVDSGNDMFVLSAEL